MNGGRLGRGAVRGYLPQPPQEEPQPLSQPPQDDSQLSPQLDLQHIRLAHSRCHRLGRLSQPTLEAVADHLSSCSRCEKALAEVRRRKDTVVANLQRFVAQWRDALSAPHGKRVRVSLDIDPAGFC